jgi:hypothetical protein
MAAGYSSRWTKLGSNTNTEVDPGADSGGKFGDQPNIDITQSATGASGINAQVRHECHMWQVGTDDFSSLNFDWAVNGDFTVVVNSAGNIPDADPGAIEVMIEGSIDNSNWTDMQDLGDFSPGTAAIVGTLVYDYDTNGRMPYMRITMNSANSTTDNRDEGFKINVFMHNL